MVLKLGHMHYSGIPWDAKERDMTKGKLALTLNSLTRAGAQERDGTHL